MRNLLLTYRERKLFQMEIKEFFSHRRSLHFLPLVIAGMFLMSWVYPPGSPYAPIIIIVLSGLEPQYANMLFHTSNELEALSVFPIAWKRVVYVKNLATIVLTVLWAILCSMMLLYFSPDVLTVRYMTDALLWLFSIMFLLINFGNEESWRHPRRFSGFLIDDAIGIVWMLILIGFFSLPYLLLVKVVKLPLLCLAYDVGTAFFWHRRSIPRTAVMIERQCATICGAV